MSAFKFRLPGRVLSWAKKPGNIYRLPAGSSDPWVYGNIISADPLIAVTKRRPNFDSPFGLLTHAPEAFRGRRSILFLSLAWSYEAPFMQRELVRDVGEARKTHPLCRVVMLANTEAEHLRFCEAGLDSLLASELLFTNDRDYQIADPLPEKRFDAVYVARLDAAKRHEYAGGIDRLLLLYQETGPKNVAAFRERLPNACFGNHDLNEGVYNNYKPPEYGELLQQAHVGICLSEVEGANRASIEYALCGLPVVSTLSIGGRDRFFDRRHARIVRADRDEVAAAVREFVASRADPREVRSEVMAQLETGRLRFVEEANSLIADTFDTSFKFHGFDPFRDASGQAMHPLSEALIPVMSP